MRTFLFTLFILAVVGGGLWYRFVGEIPIVTEKEPVFTPDEICELLSYDLDGRAGYLLEKGYEEDTHESYETYWVFDAEYALYPIGNTAKIVLFTDSNNRATAFYLIFNDDEKEEYLKFIKQFPEITSPLPKQDDQNTSQEICNLRGKIWAFGYMRDAKGYAVLIEREIKDS